LLPADTAVASRFVAREQTLGVVAWFDAASRLQSPMSGVCYTLGHLCPAHSDDLGEGDVQVAGVAEQAQCVIEKVRCGDLVVCEDRSALGESVLD